CKKTRQPEQRKVMSQLGIAKWTYLSSFTPPQKENVCFQLYMLHQKGDGKMADLRYTLWLNYYSKSWLKTYWFTVKIYWIDGKTGERQLVKGKLCSALLQAKGSAGADR